MKNPLGCISRETKTCIFLLAYWPLYGAAFYFAEKFFRPERYHVMHCALDDHIPFCELFLIPYLFWFVYLAGIHIYTLLRDRKAFQRLMCFIILSYTVGLLFFFLYPSIQLLRPEVFPRDNLLTRGVAAFYLTDTNTNVCPSLHVVGSMAAFYAARDTDLYRRRSQRIFLRVVTFLICVSTVFLKQHSVIDMAAGMLVSLFTAEVVYGPVAFRAPYRSTEQLIAQHPPRAL